MEAYRIVIKIVIVFSQCLFFAHSTDPCCKISSRASPMYKLSRHEKRSTEAIITRKNVTNVENCEKFAVSKKALAFNYADLNNADYRRTENWRNPNCQVLACPTTNGFTNLVNDTKFDYYSIYRSRISSENGRLKCLPNVGLFYISEEHLNYTDARESCRKMRATLAHIASEERTEGLGKMLSTNRTFVGLSNRDDERRWKNEFDEPLLCFDYRGWAKSEPANSRGCVVLVPPENPRTSSTWRVSSCSQILPYICEIVPHYHRRSQRNR
ncbi:uncharacterized protein [Venturia canescens]|uniref:uncharacterized protein n=1 Tax=Venturia canescens TaxID=32260 RepID=UPI001C9C5392|nr:uncharacterized protein LOC122411877 [Venturia canescens]